MKDKKKIGLASDHRGYELKNFLKEYLLKKGYDVRDFGVFDKKRTDYPDYAFSLGEALKKKKIDAGILICWTGIGMSIAVNKIKGIRGALCRTEQDALYARSHNDANILIYGAKDFESKEKSIGILKVFLCTKFKGGRHYRRVHKIEDYENRNSCC